MTIQANRNELLSLVDVKEATIDRRIFSDADIYQLELERIFARAWNFVAHDSQIPNPGDFFMTFIGEDRVIVVRDNDMQPQVLVNSLVSAAVGAPASLTRLCRHEGPNLEDHRWFTLRVPQGERA
jgi:hypothetical protein